MKDNDVSFITKMLKNALRIFLLVCVFDPADRILGLKTPLFVICWSLFVIDILINKTIPRYDKNHLLYVMGMLFVPMISIAYYYIIDGSHPYEGFSLLKSYLLITISLIIYSIRENFIPILSSFLNIMSVMIIVIFIIVLIFPEWQLIIALYGERYGFLLLGDRQYSSDLTLKSIYFVASPMICIAISHYLYLYFSSARKRWKYLVFILINCLGMFLAGTRNNMVVSIVLPLVLLFNYSKFKRRIALLSLTAFISFVIYFFNEISIMLNPEEQSNETKLELLNDYFDIFNSYDLLLGQGLGSYYNWSVRGEYFVSELTYLEVIRNYGLVLGTPVILLLLYPLIMSLWRVYYIEKYIYFAYFFYLLMSFSNPLFFSSLGMLFLSIIIGNLFLKDS